MEARPENPCGTAFRRTVRVRLGARWCAEARGPLAILARRPEAPRMSRKITATITVEGDEASLASYRRRVNELLDVEREGPYRELHDAQRLEYRISGDGVPYPVFVTVSSEFPELIVAVRWQHAVGVASGRATIRAGRLAEEATESDAAPAAGCELRADPDRTIVIGVARSEERRVGK